MNKNGRFGIYGGQYISETLMNALYELEKSFNEAMADPEFTAELDRLYREYANRPSLLYYAEKMTKDLGGARVYLKREKNKTYCGDRCRSARCCHRDSGRSVRNGMRCVHGKT